MREDDVGEFWNWSCALGINNLTSARPPEDCAGRTTSRGTSRLPRVTVVVYSSLSRTHTHGLFNKPSQSMSSLCAVHQRWRERRCRLKWLRTCWEPICTTFTQDISRLKGHKYTASAEEGSVRQFPCGHFHVVSYPAMLVRMTPCTGLTAMPTISHLHVVAGCLLGHRCVRVCVIRA